jgi:hypothetical protein
MTSKARWILIISAALLGACGKKGLDPVPPATPMAPEFFALVKKLATGGPDETGSPIGFDAVQDSYTSETAEPEAI